MGFATVWFCAHLGTGGRHPTKGVSGLPLPTQNFFYLGITHCRTVSTLACRLEPGYRGQLPHEDSMAQSDGPSGPHPGLGFRTKCHHERMPVLPSPAHAHIVWYDPYSVVTKAHLGVTPGFVIHKLCDLR